MLNRKICLLSCRSLSAELAVVRRTLPFDHVTVRSFSPNCGRKNAEVDSMTSPACGDPDLTFIFGCGIAHDMDVSSENSDRTVCVSEDQCFKLLAPAGIVAEYQKKGYYLLSPGWVMEWRDHMEEWGMTREIAREFMRESVRSLLLLETGAWSGSDENLREFADYVGLPAETLAIGTEYFASRVEKTIFRRLSEVDGHAGNTSAVRLRKQATDYAMAVDMLSDLAQTLSVEEVKQKVTTIFASLFAPRNITVHLFGEYGAGGTAPSAERDSAIAYMLEQLEESDENYVLTGKGTGFILPIGEQGSPSGIIAIDDILLPEHLSQYMNLALSMAKVIDLALKNALSFRIITDQKKTLEKALSDLRQSQEELHTLRGIIPICSYCKQIRNDGGAWERLEEYISSHSEAMFSHSVCPECFEKVLAEVEEQ